MSRIRNGKQLGMVDERDDEPAPAAAFARRNAMDMWRLTSRSMQRIAITSLAENGTKVLRHMFGLVDHPQPTGGYVDAQLRNGATFLAVASQLFVDSPVHRLVGVLHYGVAVFVVRGMPPAVTRKTRVRPRLREFIRDHGIADLKRLGRVYAFAEHDESVRILRHQTLASRH